MTSERLRALGPAVTHRVIGICHDHALQPGHLACPVARITFPTASPLLSITNRSGAGLSYLLAIAYDYDVLGLGPD
jgi:hypothetical protein